MPEVRPGSFYYQLRMVMRYLAIAILVVFVIGLFLPSTYKVTRSVIIDSTLDDVMDVIHSEQALQKWMYVKEGRVVTSEAALDGLLVGNELKSGLAFDISYDDPNKVGTLHVLSVSGSSLHFEVVPRQNAAVVDNLIQASQVDDGIQVVWTVNGELNAGLFSSYIAMFANRVAGRNFEISLKNLKNLVEQS
ncbi:hypothetical protein GV054_08880 [Marinomonas mediterranea]|jgi:Polyketide cyclase / dehydrase and lipid transport.|uniref:Polyketide cyclase/dehydrase n=1 Tax=Marinomonas mediterranea (strain ATCC 700492 / JCM 21426 / NBRC 103028 / MMB-1) TaxID=717774 RepID=F2K1B4_MARM1|nr:polyketide cyclase/dehydrase [Marinomonas mediterranea]ADZ91045.1 Polyketide cyclase/dehydrase [Marinomonas mediterranea MMB-1]WCN13113.1 hypothetical protein GV054_08880 [Marinomonas mediterranea]WCN17184.1 hypothetical protein GV053_09045 [Marinomonas mediterranea MMB-1]